MFVTTLELENLNEDKILVKLPRNKLFKVHNYYLLSEWNTDRSGSINTLSVYIDIEDKEEADKKLRFFIDFLNFLYFIDLNATSSFTTTKVKDRSMEELVLAEETKNKNIIKINDVINRLLQLNPEKQDLIIKSLHYFSRSLKLAELELYEDAFLTAYKTIELISNQIFKDEYKTKFEDAISSVIPNLLKNIFNEEYKKQGNDLVIYKSINSELKNILTARRKIKRTLVFLNLEKYIDDFGKLVQLRNSVGAHGNSEDSKIEMDDYVDCIVLAKDIISAYILGESSDKAQLDSEIKRY